MRIKIRLNTQDAEGRFLRFDETIDFEELKMKIAQKLGVDVDCRFFNTRNYTLCLRNDISTKYVDTDDINENDDIILLQEKYEEILVKEEPVDNNHEVQEFLQPASIVSQEDTAACNPEFHNAAAASHFGPEGIQEDLPNTNCGRKDREHEGGSGTLGEAVAHNATGIIHALVLRPEHRSEEGTPTFLDSSPATSTKGQEATGISQGTADHESSCLPEMQTMLGGNQEEINRDATEYGDAKKSIDFSASSDGVACHPGGVASRPPSARIRIRKARKLAEKIDTVEVEAESYKKRYRQSNNQNIEKAPPVTLGNPASGSQPLTMNIPILYHHCKAISETENLVLKEELMKTFCKLPLLSEFARPAVLLHPEIIETYSQIVSRPMDLGFVCRKLERGDYTRLRDVQLDMEQMFSNCIQFHTHPSNKKCVPSYVSVARHLQEYWNSFFLEFMVPSDTPKKASTSAVVKHTEMHAQREKARRQRIDSSGEMWISQDHMIRIKNQITAFLGSCGCVDDLDQPVFPDDASGVSSQIDEDGLRDIQTVKWNLEGFRERLSQLSAVADTNYTLQELDADFKNCFLEVPFENNSALKSCISNRINRIIGKISLRIDEANSRGLALSSVWGCAGAIIWARQSSNKPFWPALVLGYMQPDNLKERWHEIMTTKNEERLPHGLRTQLLASKQKAEKAMRANSGSSCFFFVEFLGTHEFLWVRETDTHDNFQPGFDPNFDKAGGRGSVSRSKQYQTAIQEASWALESYERQMQDTYNGGVSQDCANLGGQYGYGLLSREDDEADSIYLHWDNLSGAASVTMGVANGKNPKKRKGSTQECGTGVPSHPGGKLSRTIHIRLNKK